MIYCQSRRVIWCLLILDPGLWVGTDTHHLSTAVFQGRCHPILCSQVLLTWLEGAENGVGVFTRRRLLRLLNIVVITALEITLVIVATFAHGF